MAWFTKKAKIQAIPALANAPRHVSTSNQLGDLLVEDDLDNTGTPVSSNSKLEADDFCAAYDLPPQMLKHLKDNSYGNVTHLCFVSLVDPDIMGFIGDEKVAQFLYFRIRPSWCCWVLVCAPSCLKISLCFYFASDSLAAPLAYFLLYCNIPLHHWQFELYLYFDFQIPPDLFKNTRHA